MSARVTPGTADTASYASATISQEKFGAQKNVGQPQRTVATPSPETVHDATNSRSVIGSSSSGSQHRPQRRPDGVPEDSAHIASSLTLVDA